MCDTNWCTFCDCAVSPYSDSIYCSEDCFRRDALTHHPLFVKLRQQQQMQGGSDHSTFATLMSVKSIQQQQQQQQQQRRIRETVAVDILDTPPSLTPQHHDTNSSNSSSLSSDGLALMHLDHIPDIAETANNGNNNNASRSFESSCTTSHDLKNQSCYCPSSSNSHFIYNMHSLSFSHNSYVLQ